MCAEVTVLQSLATEQINANNYSITCKHDKSYTTV